MFFLLANLIREQHSNQLCKEILKAVETATEFRTMSLIQGLPSRFLVIYDSPPLSGLADAHLIEAHTDATIMVVQMAKTDRSQVSKVLEELKFSGASVLGVVANGCKNSNHSYRQRPVGIETIYDQKLSALGTKNQN